MTSISVVMAVAPRRTICAWSRELIVEARRRTEADVRLGDHRVHAALDHLLPGPHRCAPQLGERDIEVQQVVGVENDALRVALSVADAQLVDEGIRHQRTR